MLLSAQISVDPSELLHFKLEFTIVHFHLLLFLDYPEGQEGVPAGFSLDKPILIKPSSVLVRSPVRPCRKRAIVALESTVIAHGLPRPQNLETLIA
jgi:hypothetical protein